MCMNIKIYVFIILSVHNHVYMYDNYLSLKGAMNMIIVPLYSY